MSDFHLAELNVAQPVAPIGSPELAPFEALLDEVNALAEAQPGFVWRLQDEEGNATSFTLLGDPDLIVNLPVWESVEALRAFAYAQPGHKRPMRRRREWFVPLAEAHLVLWWVPAGHRPGLEEAEERLLRLRAEGPGPEAFTFRAAFPAPEPGPVVEA
jgi:hypothetical protein